MNQTLQSLFRSYFDEYVEKNPIMATFIGIHEHNHIYPNYFTDREIKISKEFDKKYLSLLRKIDYQKLNNKNKHHYKVLESRLKNDLEGYKFRFELLPMDQFNNIVLDFVDMASGKSYLPLKTKKDFQNLILKTKDFMEVLETAICRMREGVVKKIVYSKPVVKMTIKQLQDVVKSKDYIVKGCPKSLEVEYMRILNNELTLKIKKLAEFMKKEYLPHASNSLALPLGKEAYQYLVKSYTTLKNPSVESIHKLGLSEVKRINKEVDNLFDSNNMKRPSNEELRKMTYKSRTQVINEYEKIRKLVNNKIMPKYFNITISHDYLLKRVPKFKEEGDAGAYYMMCSIDNKRKGTFYLNLANLEDHQTYSTLSLSLHEGNPGHHFQLTYVNDLNLPDFLTYCGDEIAYVEGWGLYSESLAHDFLKDSKKEEDIMFRYGCYNYELLRACRLVIDTGIHYYDWDFKKCMDFMKKNTTFSTGEIKNEIYRYSTYAGQALAYKIGELKFKELKAYFLKNKMGSVKDFHKKVLELGACSLELLEKIIKK